MAAEPMAAEPMEGSLYLTLSHRWGISQPTKLTKASLDDMRAGLAVKELPGLYQDAITVAKWFGIRYIWVDSLCIFQDDDEDFQIELVKCKRVTLDLCNIAVSTGVAESKFSTCDPDPVGLNAVSVFKEVSGLDKDYLIVDHNLWQDEINNTLLTKRGWVINGTHLRKGSCCVQSHSDVYKCVGTFIVKEDRAYSLQPWWLPNYWKIFSVDALRADLSQKTISSDPPDGTRHPNHTGRLSSEI